MKYGERFYHCSESGVYVYRGPGGSWQKTSKFTKEEKVLEDISTMKRDDEIFTFFDSSMIPCNV